jgi:hypothetical protein
MQKIKTVFIISILFGFIAISCVTQRKCNSKFPPSRDTIRLEHTRDSIIIKDSLIPVFIPGEIVYDSVPVPCPPPPPAYVPDTAYTETTFATAKAWFDYPNIIIKLEQKDTTVLLKAALKEAYHWRSEFQKITTVPEPVKYIPKIYKQALSICIVIFIAAFLFIGWKGYKYFN